MLLTKSMSGLREPRETDRCSPTTHNVWSEQTPYSQLILSDVEDSSVLQLVQLPQLFRQADQGNFSGAEGASN
jgi:hypothetical protein